LFHFQPLTSNNRTRHSPSSSSISESHRVHHACAPVGAAFDSANSTCTYNPRCSGYERRKRHSSNAQAPHAGALRSLREAVSLLPALGPPLRTRRLFSHHENTQDIDYIHRPFVSEYCALGFPDAEQRFRICIVEASRKFGVGADGANDPVDVAFP
jgi:hypothetical protein